MKFEKAGMSFYFWKMLLQIKSQLRKACLTQSQCQCLHLHVKVQSTIGYFISKVYDAQWASEIATEIYISVVVSQAKTTWKKIMLGTTIHSPENIRASTIHYVTTSPVCDEFQTF